MSSPTYRYEVTALDGETPSNVKVGSFVVDHMDRGDETEWTICDTRTGKVTGRIIAKRAGRFVPVDETNTDTGVGA